MKTEVRRLIVVLGAAVLFALAVLLNPNSYETEQSYGTGGGTPALDALATLPVKGRAPKTGYSREQFFGSSSWGTLNGCDLRNVILARDLYDIEMYELKDGDDRQKACYVARGTLNDPYTGNVIHFVRGENSSAVQVDHVIALSNAWQTGAQEISFEERKALANDPLNLLAADGPANQQKSDADAATWLPPNKSFRCTYVARQIAVKLRYRLWVTKPEKAAMADVLKTCPDESIPG